MSETAVLQIQSYCEPISPELPGGVPVRAEPAFELLQREVGKLESLSGGEVEWAQVVERGGYLLSRVGKDLLVAAYVAAALGQQHGAEGAAVGVAVLAELLERYWDTAFPEASRLRGRINAVDWLVQRMGAEIAAGGAGLFARGRPEQLQALSAAVSRLEEVVGRRLGSAAPSLLGIRQRLEILGREAPPEPKAPSAPTTPPPVQAASAPETPPADAVGVGELLRSVGASLVSAAGVLRRMGSANPDAYRLMRVGIWLHVSQLPPSGPERKTTLPPLTPTLRESLEKMAAHQRWEAILEESESALTRYRFSLDLQRYSAEALSALGREHESAQRALVDELGAFVRRLPGVTELIAVDGTPFADGRTRAWLETEIAGSASKSAATAAPQDGQDEAGWEGVGEEAQRLFSSGQVVAALAGLHRYVATRPQGRARFVARLRQAQLCAAAGQVTLALGLLEALDREAQARGLDDWDPALSAECLEALLSHSRAAPRGSTAINGVDVGFALRYHRLCTLDPVAALRVGSP